MNGNSYRNNNMNNNYKNHNNSTKSSNYKNNINGFDHNRNKYVENSTYNKDAIANSLEKARMNSRKAAAREAIKTGLNSVAPGTGTIANQALKTEKGDKLVEEYLNAESPTQGLIKVGKTIRREQKMTKFFLSLLISCLPFLFLLLFIVIIAKNADTQIYSNENNGQLDFYDPDNPLETSVFANYPGLYEKVEAAVTKVSNQYKIEIDKYLILATLIAPIENGTIIPVKDGKCGEAECYYFEGKAYTWKEFLSLWGDQSEFLAKAQILTYINESSNLKVKCDTTRDDMITYSSNDMEVNNFNFWALFNPFNWFKGFRNAAEAEVNAKCIMDVPVGESSIPTVRVLSKEEGIHYNSITADGDYDVVEDPNSGGVYFWNLSRINGFIHVYMKDYLNINPTESDEQNYDANRKKILEITDYIYTYYESIRKDCNGYNLVPSTIETINVAPGEGGPGGAIDFEDQYIGGVMLAEYHSGNLESRKAFAILARSFAISVVGVDGSGTIENSSNDQNYNPDYSPEKYPEIAEAVEATRGLVVTDFGTTNVYETMYDGFCPVKTVLDNGFYYLPDGQNNLPINPDAYQRKTGGPFIVLDKYLQCPCFQNYDSRPHDEVIDRKQIKYHSSSSNPPTHALGYPPQTTVDVCWTPTSNTRTNPLTLQTEYGWAYKPGGGHGQGASQLGLKYFAEFEYEAEALIKLFYGDDISIKRLTSSLEDGECENSSTKSGGACGVTFDISDSNYTSAIGGSALNTTLTEALSSNGYDASCLDGCISARVNAATSKRGKVVEAGIGLLECTMEMTGGFTYPYDHRGGAISYMGSGTGINPKWGEYTDYATGCGTSKCRLGLNCANFVRWSMCNGGQSSLCSKGSTFATGMAGVNSSDPDYFPGAIRIYFNGNNFDSEPNVSISNLSSNYKSILGKSSGNINSLSVDEVISLIQPGDVLYSDRNGGSNHVMLVTGVDGSGIWIAENGRKTRKISNSELKSNSKNYVVLLLDDFYG